MRLALALCALATGAAAEGCPTAADLETGITLSSSVIDMTVFNQLGPTGLMVTSVTPGDSGTTFSTAIYAHPLALPERLNGPTAIYDGPVDGLEDLYATRAWEGSLTLETDNGSFRAEHAIALTGLGTSTLSGCDYEVWRIDETITFPDGTVQRLRKVYAPDLGLVIAETVIDANGNPTGGLVFDQITAE